MNTARSEMTTLRYFAWVREKAGLSEEEVRLPDTIVTVADLLVWQRGRGAGFSEAFGNVKGVRVAINQMHARPDALVAGCKEIAFFPPVTGG